MGRLLLALLSQERRLMSDELEVTQLSRERRELVMRKILRQDIFGEHIPFFDNKLITRVIPAHNVVCRGIG